MISNLWNQYKIPVMLLLIAGYSAFLIWSTWQVATGREAKKELNVVEEKIDQHNESEVEIGETVRYVEKTKIQYRDRIVHLPPVDVSGPCPIDELTRLRNEAYGAIPAEFFESTD